ncbi:uncharacterized protein LOC136080456 [Hydra vulgaris]|uniref:Uncharacterized protein LOC136080456 n=1 Tax=Hydra vulgaris TaxID=6087 RepID=A0ABM4BVF2_HYDVU
MRSVIVFGVLALCYLSVECKKVQKLSLTTGTATIKKETGKKTAAKTEENETLEGSTASGDEPSVAKETAKSSEVAKETAKSSEVAKETAKSSALTKETVPAANSPLTSFADAKSDQTEQKAIWKTKLQKKLNSGKKIAKDKKKKKASKPVTSSVFA